VEAGPPTSVRYVATAAGRDARRLLRSLRDYARRHPDLF
jgi:DNA-binding HxlR family transcriptional regulator